MQVFTLNDKIDPKTVEGSLLKTYKHEIVSGAYVYKFSVTEGAMLLTAIAGNLQEVTYEFRTVFPWLRKKKLKSFLTLYGIDKGWSQEFSNRSGSLYHSQDELYYATWNRKLNFVSIGVLFFREEMQRAVT